MPLPPAPPFPPIFGELAGHPPAPPAPPVKLTPAIPF